MERTTGRHAAVLFADIVGSTAIYAGLGNARALAIVEETLRRIAQVAAAFGGRRIKTIGDALLIEFSGALDACLAAVEMPLSLPCLPDSTPVTIRIGVDYGEVVETGDDLFGDPVNVAAHICKRANPGAIVATGAVERKMPRLIRAAMRPLGSFHVKSRPEPLLLFEMLRINGEDDSVTVASAITAVPGQREGRRLVLEHRGKAREFGDSAFPVTIGRDRYNHLALFHHEVSRTHARIDLREGRVILNDLSSNGTSVYFGGTHLVTARREQLVLFDSGTIACGGTAVEIGDDIIHFQVVER